MDKNKIKGGLADNKSTKDLADKHQVSVKDIEKEIKKGTKVEKEHTSDTDVAKEIAKDHAYEDDKYYEKLEKMEESTKEIIKSYLKEEITSTVTDENPDTITVVVNYNNVSIGMFKIINANAKDTLEIVGIKFKKDYDSMFIIGQGVKSLWEIFTEKNAIIVSPEPEAIGFWNKLGFNRISPNYLILNKGH